MASRRDRRGGDHLATRAHPGAGGARSGSSLRTERRARGSACTRRRTDRSRRSCSWSHPGSRACLRTCSACRRTLRACRLLHPIPPWRTPASPAARAEARPLRAASPQCWRTDTGACPTVARRGGTCKPARHHDLAIGWRAMCDGGRWQSHVNQRGRSVPLPRRRSFGCRRGDRAELARFDRDDGMAARFHRALQPSDGFIDPFVVVLGIGDGLLPECICLMQAGCSAIHAALPIRRFRPDRIFDDPARGVVNIGQARGEQGGRKRGKARPVLTGWGLLCSQFSSLGLEQTTRISPVRFRRMPNRNVRHSSRLASRTV